jgi:hypothetical protein
LLQRAALLASPDDLPFTSKTYTETAIARRPITVLCIRGRSAPAPHPLVPVYSRAVLAAVAAARTHARARPLS